MKLVDQSESNLSLDIQQALDVNSFLINQVKFHLIDLLASITHSISTVTLARRDSFLSTVPKHVPDHIVKELRSHPIYGRRVLLLVLVPFEVPINHVVESLPGVGAKSPNLNLNNDVLQEVRVPLELSKVPLIPPDPTTLPVGGRLVISISIGSF